MAGQYQSNRDEEHADQEPALQPGERLRVEVAAALPQLLVDQLAALEPPPPLVMVPRRQRKQLNAQLSFLGEPAEIFIHPDDGAAAGVVNGRPVTVRSANGELTGVAKIDDSIRRGAVSIPHGHHEANVNRLTNKDDIDVVTGMVRYSGIPVSLHPA